MTASNSSRLVSLLLKLPPIRWAWQPNIPEDSDLGNLIVIRHRILRTSIVLIWAALIVEIAFSSAYGVSQTPYLIMMLAAAVVVAGCTYVIHRGHITATAVIFLLLMTALGAAVIFGIDNYTSSMMPMVYVMAMVIAGVTLSGWSVLLVGIINITMVFIAGTMQHPGFLVTPPPQYIPDPDSLLLDYIIYGVISSIVCVMQIGFTNALKREQEQKDHAAIVASIISHDGGAILSNILTNISYALKGARGPVSKEMKEVLEGIQREIKKAHSQQRVALKFLQLSSGNYTPEFQPIDLVGIIQAEINSREVKASEQNVSLQLVPVQLAGNVITDVDLLTMVLSNLLDNAIKYNKQGGFVTVSIEQQPKLVMITIADTGQGMAPEAIPHIFKMYRQTRKADQKKGHGLGLAIVAFAIKLIDGMITVTSQEGEGSQFTIVLPYNTQ